MPKGKTRTAARLIFGLALLAALLPTPPQVASATHALPPLDPSQVDYDPIGYYGPEDEAGTSVGESATIPPVPPTGPPPVIPGPNPSGKFIAYDTNVWESLHLPMRHPGDNCNSLPVEERHPDCRAGDMDPDNDGPQGYSGPGGVSTVHGVCPPSPGFMSGECFNSQLEWLDYYEQQMKTLLAPFGGVVRRYGFQSTGGGLIDGQPRGTYLAASGGQAYNIAAVVPGADHPEETVLVSGHYDFTDSGPAAAWDSAEGHTEVMRMAYIMADYWKKTGTRPSVTVKFIPWDSEESGTQGSIHYVNNNIPPLPNGQPDASLVRAYFNVDPCAGAYPAFKDGNFTERIPEVMQLAAPVNARISAFNAKAEIIIDQVFDRLDDTITTPTGERPIFVSNAEAAAGENGGDSQRDEIITNTSGLAIFSSDYANFEAIGVPIFNLFPDMLGPHGDDSDEEAAGRDTTGISILHTPNDNLTRINKLTSGLTTPGNAPDSTGLFASEGWAKGMEFCAQANAWYMLQPEMAGAQTSNTDVVAYYEALPNEALQNQNVTFDASETYQYADPTTQALVPQSELTYTWDFGDGTTGTGMVAQHAYANIGRYITRLTVTGRGGSTDSMTVPVNVIGSNFVGPVLDAIPPADARDGTFALNWDFTATRDGFSHFRIEESKNILKLFSEDAEGAVTTKWSVSVVPANSMVQPWQESDSSTLKFRSDNPHRSGAQSYWTGVSPQDFNPAPTNVNSILQMKTPVTIPTIIGGEPELSFFSLFQNEGDDQGRVEIALVDTLGNVGPFEAIDVQQATMTAVGQEDPLICDPSRPDEVLAQGFTMRRISLAAYQGKTVLIRFVYSLGAENRVLSQPCGWFIEDIQMSNGTFSPLGTTTAQTFQVTGRKNGQFGYRVVGVYTDNVSTAPSNTEIVFVCRRTSRRTSIPC